MAELGAVAAGRAIPGCSEGTSDQANKTGDAVGRGRWKSSFLGLAGAKFFKENHQERKRKAEHKEGTFLSSFDACLSCSIDFGQPRIDNSFQVLEFTSTALLGR
jgi:hypothetical protein